MNFLADNFLSITPPLQENYHNNYDTNTIIIAVLAILVVVLIAVLVALLYLYFKSRKRLQQLELRTFEPSRNDLSGNELQVISEYRKLDEQGKELVNNTIQTLNSKNK